MPCRQLKSRRFSKSKSKNFQSSGEAEEHRYAVRTLKDFFSKALVKLGLILRCCDSFPALTQPAPGEQHERAVCKPCRVERSKNINVFANRGTSGIDGCTSTAVGHSLINELPDFLITGDLAFFTTAMPSGIIQTAEPENHFCLTIAGGIIFKMIDGPSSLPETDEYFVTRQSWMPKNFAKGLSSITWKNDNKRKIRNTLKTSLIFDGTTKILELETAIDLNKTIFDNLKQKIKEELWVINIPVATD